MDSNRSFIVNGTPYSFIDGILNVMEHEKVHRICKQKALKLQDRFTKKGYYINKQFKTLDQINQIIKEQNEKP